MGSFVEMFSAILYLVCLISLLADRYLYQSVFREKSRSVRFLWILQSAIFILPFPVIFIGNFFIDNPITWWGLFGNWSVSVFFTQFIPKALFSVAVYLKSRRSGPWIPAAWIMTVLFVFLYQYGTWVSRCEIRVSRVEVVSQQLPESFDGFRIVQFSDTHVGSMFLDRNLLERVVDTINGLNPDMTAFCGDLVNVWYPELTPTRIAALKKLNGSPVFSVTGNHDLAFYIKDTVNNVPEEVLSRLRHIQIDTLGWTLLENDRIYVKRGEDSIAVAGVSYPNDIKEYFNNDCGGSDIAKAMQGVDSAGFAVLLCHLPDMVDSLPGKTAAVDLMLSGHTHGMQLKIFGWCPSLFTTKYPSGMYRTEGTVLYVNDGIGSVGHPFRLGAPPEITCITLKHSKP